MTTAADLVSETEAHLLSGQREMMNVLNGDIDNATQTIPFTYNLNGIREGAYVALDLEIVYVWTVDDNAKSAHVQRAMLGSVAAPHLGGTLAYVNPKFPKLAIFRQLNVALADISPELFQVKEFDLTTQPVQMTYTIPASAADMLDIVEIRWQPPGATKPWMNVRSHDWSIMRNMPTTGDGAPSSGIGLRLDDAYYPGRQMAVRYAAPFAPLTALTDDVTTVTGLPASSADIPPLGAAMWLMGVREAKRSFTESVGDTRRASEVPSGAASRSAQILNQLYKNRITSEAQALRKLWPFTR